MAAPNTDVSSAPRLDDSIPMFQPNGTHQTNGVGQGPQVVSTSGSIEVQCGPLLNYKRMSNAGASNARWHGSILLVTTPGQQTPQLGVQPVRATRHSSAADQFVDAPEEQANGPTYREAQPNGGASQQSTYRGEKLYADQYAEFWRFLISVPLGSRPARWQYHIPNVKYVSGASASKLATRIFHVPASHESMRIMFHSCNGFSVGTDEDAWSGCALWNDVLRTHETKPLHVMIGGGDQIYNDGIRVNGPLRHWCDIRDPIKRQKFPFTEELRAACDKFYLDNYIRWYSTEPFASANGEIPQINIWDDHDIIDGFGSYVDHFMRCSVFRGIGGVAHKYYLLFQQHVPPPTSTFTTDAPSTMSGNDPRADPKQLQSSFVMHEKSEDPSFLFGRRPGPYVEERSRSIYCELGAQIAFLGIDARTERTRHQINYDDTYQMLFRHVDSQLNRSAGRIKHFILLLGVPIAYPRLQWLENILQSPVMGAVRFANKRFGVAGGLFNNFDGSVDLMDDLDDHYTAHQHKKERRDLITRLQKLAKQHNVRVTILGGDVHLAAFGRFFSKPRLNIPIENDHRYISNVVSSAITNHPPPAAVANLLAKRNKIHHLDHETDETLLNLFDYNPGRVPGHEATAANGKEVPMKGKQNNHATMPSRNYAILGLSHAQNENGHAVDGAGSLANGQVDGKYDTHLRKHHNWSRKSGNPRDALHAGEDSCGTSHPAASGTQPTGLGGAWGLDVTYRIEIDNHDREGKTEGYGLTIPELQTAKTTSDGAAIGKMADKVQDAGEEAEQKV